MLGTQRSGAKLLSQPSRSKLKWHVELPPWPPFHVYGVLYGVRRIQIYCKKKCP